MSPQCPQEPESQDSMSLASSGSPLLFSCLPASSDGELTTWGCRPGESAPLWAPAQMEGKLSSDGHCPGLLIWGRASLETGARRDLACLSSPSPHRCPGLPCSLEASCNCMRQEGRALAPHYSCGNHLRRSGLEPPMGRQRLTSDPKTSPRLPGKAATAKPCRLWLPDPPLPRQLSESQCTQ